MSKVDDLMAVPGVSEFAAEQARRLAARVLAEPDVDRIGTALLALSKSVGRDLLWPIVLTALWLLGQQVRAAQAANQPADEAQPPATGPDGSAP